MVLNASTRCPFAKPGVSVGRSFSPAAKTLLILPQGRVASRVESKGGQLRALEVTVPVGSTATVCLPAQKENIREGGRKLKASHGIVQVADGDTTEVTVSKYRRSSKKGPYKSENRRHPDVCFS